jgi:hypothetical protein
VCDCAKNLHSNARIVLDHNRYHSSNMSVCYTHLYLCISHPISSCFRAHVCIFLLTSKPHLTQKATAPIVALAQLHAALDACQFAQFWALAAAEPARSLVAAVPNFAAAGMGATASLLCERERKHC